MDVEKPGRTMLTLQRITTQHDLAEDRIGLTGTDAGGQTVVLWLTHRLLNQLVVRLCQGLERMGPRPSMSSALQQSFAQQSAHAALPRQPAVAPLPGAPQWRVDGVDVQHSANGAQLRFKGVQPADQALLRLPTPGLRQWLGIVYGQYRRAGWALDVWPAWMVEAQMPPTPPTAAALH